MPKKIDAPNYKYVKDCKYIIYGERGNSYAMKYGYDLKDAKLDAVRMLESHLNWKVTLYKVVKNVLKPSMKFRELSLSPMTVLKF